MEDINFTKISNAIYAANRTLATADNQAYQIARVISGRLRQINADGDYHKTELLKKLKKELSQFNAHTGQWNK